MNRSFEMTIHGARLTGVSRRGILAAGGAMMALFAIKAGPASAIAPAPSASVAQGWIEIRADNTVLLCTGKCDFGHSAIYSAYRQIVAGELRANDMQWSTQSSAFVAGIRIALDTEGRIAAYEATNSGPGMQDDRLVRLSHSDHGRDARTQGCDCQQS